MSYRPLTGLGIPGSAGVVVPLRKAARKSGRDDTEDSKE